MLKFSIIGCGRIAKNHLQAATENNLSIVALCDINDIAFDVDAPHYTCYKTMIAERKPDLVAIATDSGSHAEIACYCIQQGVHVIIEKPMAMSIAEADQIISLAQKHQVKVSVCHQNRYNLAVQQVREATVAGHFGKLSHATVHVRWNRSQDYYTQAPWRGTWAKDGGALMNQCIHGIDLLQWLVNSDVTEVYAVTKNQQHPYLEVEDVGLALVKFANGAIATIEGTTNVYPENLEETIYLFGGTGTAKLGGKSVNTIEVWNFENAEGTVMVEDVPNIYGNGHARLYSDWIQAIINDTEAPCNPTEGKKALELILAIYKSSKEGLPVQLPLEDFASIDMKGFFDESSRK